MHAAFIRLGEAAQQNSECGQHRGNQIIGIWGTGTYGESCARLLLEEVERLTWDGHGIYHASLLFFLCFPRCACFRCSRVLWSFTLLSLSRPLLFLTRSDPAFVALYIVLFKFRTIFAIEVLWYYGNNIIAQLDMQRTSTRLTSNKRLWSK